MKRPLPACAATTLGLLIGLTGLPHGVARAATASVRPWHEDADHMGSGLPARLPAHAPRELTTTVAPVAAATLKGLDVSAFQENVDWSAVAAKGASFAYVKATEGVNYTSGQFAQQYNGSAAA